MSENNDSRQQPFHHYRGGRGGQGRWHGQGRGGGVRGGGGGSSSSSSTNNQQQYAGVGRGRYRGNGRFNGNTYPSRGGRGTNNGPNRSHHDGRGGRGRAGGRQNNNNRIRFQNNGRRNYDGTSIDVVEQIGKIPIDETTRNETISIAIEGCCHGELDRIYDRIEQHENDNPNQNKIELLLCCGDFQSIRCIQDFHSMAVPSKYRSLGTFYQYYAHIRTPPVLTIFIGGNHEASQPLSELYYGGWVAPNIYYLGAAGVVTYKGIRIAGISGIYKNHDYKLPRYEQPPFDASSLRSIYHVRDIDVYRMKCLGQSSPTAKIDILLSHDWPLGIEQFGNTEQLLRKKPFLRQEIIDNNLGSQPNREILDIVQPSYWFAAHLHVKFHATITHNSPDSEQSPSTDTQSKKANPTSHLIPSQVIRTTPVKPKETALLANEDIDKELGVEKKVTDQVNSDELEFIPLSTESQQPMSESSNVTNPDSNNSTHFVAVETTAKSCQTNIENDLSSQMTKFLSLDKCLPRREYLSILHLPIPPKLETTTESNDASKLHYDPQWLAILRKTHSLQQRKQGASGSINKSQRHYDVSKEALIRVTSEDIDEVRQYFDRSFVIPENFQPTVPAHTSESVQIPHRLPRPFPRMGNPQTDELLSKLQLDHIITIPWDETQIPTQMEQEAQQEEETRDVEVEQMKLNVEDDNEIDIDCDDDYVDRITDEQATTDIQCQRSSNENIDVPNNESHDSDSEITKRPRLTSSS